MTKRRDEIINLKRSTVRILRSLLPALIFSAPGAAWAGRSTEGLIYLFLPFFVAFAIFLTGTALSLAYLIICIFRAKKDRFMAIGRAKIYNQRLLWIWKVAVLIWIMIIVFGVPNFLTSVYGFVFAAILVAIPGGLAGLPILMLISINNRFSR